MKKQKLSNIENKAGQTFLTSLRLLWHQSNDMCNNYYFAATARVYSEDHRYYKLHFVVWIDGDDVWEWMRDDDGQEPEGYTLKDVRECAREYAYSWLECNVPTDINDDEKRRDMYQTAGETIDRYNHYAAA